MVQKAAFLRLLDKEDLAYVEDSTGILVHDDLDLIGSPLTELPDNLTVSGSLFLNGLALVRLPQNLSVAHELSLFQSPVTSIPQGTFVGYDLMLRESRVASLPRDFKLLGDLDIAHTPITVLPPGLDVGAGLVLTKTDVRSFPQDMVVQGVIVPPDSLENIQAFLQTQDGDVLIEFPASHHRRMQIQDMLQGFPDLLRVAHSLEQGDTLRLTKNADGTCSVTYRAGPEMDLS